MRNPYGEAVESASGCCVVGRTADLLKEERKGRKYAMEKCMVADVVARWRTRNWLMVHQTPWPSYTPPTQGRK